MPTHDVAIPHMSTADADDAWFLAWRHRELTRLVRDGSVYADYTGAALYPESLVQRDAERLHASLLGNPHSEHGASLASTRDLDAARHAILRFLGASPDDYDVVLTANASAGCRLVGESFPWSAGGALLLTADNHNSVNGMREFAERGGAAVRTIGLTPELRLDGAMAALNSRPPAAPALFAFPAQSNFSGVRHPLSLVRSAQELGWRVLLDAASYLQSGALDLHDVQPDYLVLSLYKIVGYPTGLGALVVRHDALAALRRPWFAGGTVQWVSVRERTHLLASGHDAFEDGTPAFITAGAVPAALDAAIAADRPRLARHLSALTAHALHSLCALRHGNGAPLVRVHGPCDGDDRGPTIAITLADANGASIPYWIVERDAREAGVAVRGGCFCNPGCAEAAFGLATPEAARCLAALGDTFSIPRFASCLGDRAVGAVRLSFGLGSVRADVDRVVAFLARYAAPIELAYSA